MARSNTRLAECGAPALLREFTLNVDLSAAIRLPENGCGVLLTDVAKPSAQLTALLKGLPPTVTIEATYIAAPACQPTLPVPTLEAADP
jgi:hypothetical protein